MKDLDVYPTESRDGRFTVLFNKWPTKDLLVQSLMNATYRLLDTEKLPDGIYMAEPMIDEHKVVFGIKVKSDPRLPEDEQVEKTMLLAVVARPGMRR